MSFFLEINIVSKSRLINKNVYIGLGSGWHDGGKVDSEFDEKLNKIKFFISRKINIYRRKIDYGI